MNLGDFGKANLATSFVDSFRSARDRTATQKQNEYLTQLNNIVSTGSLQDPQTQQQIKQMMQDPGFKSTAKNDRQFLQTFIGTLNQANDRNRQREVEDRRYSLDEQQANMQQQLLEQQINNAKSQREAEKIEQRAYAFSQELNDKLERINYIKAQLQSPDVPPERKQELQNEHKQMVEAYFETNNELTEFLGNPTAYFAKGDGTLPSGGVTLKRALGDQARPNTGNASTNSYSGELSGIPRLGARQYQYNGGS